MNTELYSYWIIKLSVILVWEKDDLFWDIFIILIEIMISCFNWYLSGYDVMVAWESSTLFVPVQDWLSAPYFPRLAQSGLEFRVFYLGPYKFSIKYIGKLTTEESDKNI